MTRRQYEVGQIVFAEGDDCDFVCLISDGEVEISRGHGGADVIIGHLTAGDYVGEMAAIEGKPHSATARATGRLAVDCFDRTEFLRHVSRDSELAYRLLERLSHRLHRLDDAYAAAVSTNREISAGLTERAPASGTAAESGPAAVTLYPASDRVATALPANGLAVARLPFIVGRTPSLHEQPPGRPIDLLFDETAPYRLSRLHFEIVESNGRIQVRDLNSHLGTIVNGVYVGRYFPRDAVELERGENTIVAGGEDSPYIFRVVVGG